MSFQIAVRWTANGGSPTTRFRAAIESIPAWHERIRNVVILNRDAFDVIPKIPDEPGVAIYLDPPYLHSTRIGDGDGGYLHDFEEFSDDFMPLLSEDDKPKDKHQGLAEVLQRFKYARVVVSYYDHPRIRELYHGWTIIDHTRQKNLHTQNRRGMGKAEAPEILILNGPSYANPKNKTLF